MTDDSQTHLEAGISRADILKPKVTLRVGCWNVRTLYQTGKLAQVIKEMESYNLELIGVSETRWTGSGNRQLATGHQIMYSGRTDDHHSKGVAIITTKQVHKCLLEWKPVNERIIKARYNSSFAKLTVIVCYAPTEDSPEVEKDIFYDKLQELVDETPSHDVLLIMGDLNAKVGSKNEGKESTMGKQGMGEINDNGERLTALCQENRLVIGGTIFEHKNIHKLTWTSPDGNTRNQIDHIIINNRWRSSLQDVVAKRGADVGSDHTLRSKDKIKTQKDQENRPKGTSYECSKTKRSRREEILPNPGEEQVYSFTEPARTRPVQLQQSSAGSWREMART